VARLFADENFPLKVVEYLSQLGHDVATVHERGLAGESTSDQVILSIAIREQRAVLTHDRRDYFLFHRDGVQHEGIIACTADQNYRELAQRIHEALDRSPLLTGQYIRIVKPQQSPRTKETE
jgi:predicted nuclease of predicted toxin-antitoxin system